MERRSRDVWLFIISYPITTPLKTGPMREGNMVHVQGILFQGDKNARLLRDLVAGVLENPAGGHPWTRYYASTPCGTSLSIQPLHRHRNLVQ